MSRFRLIAGPCVIESEENVMLIAEKVKGIAQRLDLEYYFKASFDKANRTSISACRGPGIDEGIRILKKVKDKFGLKICTDIHEPWQAEKAAEAADIIQIPAFLCRQTDLLTAAARTGKIINVKKAQFLAPWDMRNVVRKIEESGNKNIMLCERGTSFGYNTLVVDMTGIVEMKKCGYPVIMDATHSVQKPGGKGTATGGNREYVEPLAKAAVAAGADALFFEVHPDPDNALSDGSNMVNLDEFEGILERVAAVYDTVHNTKSYIKMNPMAKTDKLAEGKRVFDIEMDALRKTRNALNEDFASILDSIISCKGKLVITGMGKPGHIAAKLAATFASLGTASFYLDPAEAMHGDLGMISPDDVVMAISYSGESDEIIKILPNIKMLGAKVLGITGNANSTLARESDIVQVFPKFEEACYLGLAPTSSTTAELVYGDALAVVASGVYGFKDTDFGKIHPAGSLGKKLVLRVDDLMVRGENNPVIAEDASMKDAIVVISKREMGMTSVVDAREKLVGIITDGDLRRALENGVDIYSMRASELMSKSPVTVGKDILAVKALSIMKEKNINCLIVVDEHKPIGGIKMQNILSAGIVDNMIPAGEILL